MAGLVTQTARVVWEGTVARGEGRISGASGAVADVPFDLPNRIGEATGKSSPEEFLAAAHAGCFVTSLGSELARRRTPPQRLEVASTVTLDLTGERPRISRVDVAVSCDVPGLDQAELDAALADAEAGCLISRTLRNGQVEIATEGTLGGRS